MTKGGKIEISLSAAIVSVHSTCSEAFHDPRLLHQLTVFLH
jgi:hypothetical protein